MAYKYFLYSSEQEKFMRKIQEQMGKTFNIGTVYYKGSRKSFTEMSSSPNNRYSDMKIVAEGDDTKMKYTLPTGR